MFMAILAALTATALWGFTFIGPKAVDPINVWYLVVGRYAVFSLMSIYVIVSQRSYLYTMRRNDIAFALHLGIVGYIGFYLFLSLSVVTSDGVLASLITGIIPAAVATVWNVRTRDTPWRKVIVPIVFTSAGLVILNLGHPSSDVASGTDHNVLLGSAFALMGCVAWVYFVVSNAVRLKTMPSGFSMPIWTALIGLGAGLGSLCIIPFLPLTDGPSPFETYDTFIYFLGWCIVLAVLGSWCATWCWTWATRRLPTQIAAQIIAAETIFGTAFNLAWERRAPSVAEVLGGFLVLGGVAVCVALYGADKRSRALKGASDPGLLPSQKPSPQ